MIWIIASIPFWILAVLIFGIGFASIGMSFDTAFLKRENIIHKRTGHFAFGVVCLSASGPIALLAAKICS